MKRIVFSLLLVLFFAPDVLPQSIGRVQLDERVFSTGMSRNENNLPQDSEMSAERRAIALKCIEKTFGRVVQYEEGYSETCPFHHLSVTLESGDEVEFEDGLLFGYDLKSAHFSVAQEWFRGGLRVGQMPAQPLSADIRVEQRTDHPDWFNFWNQKQPNDIISYYRVAPDGTIVEIFVAFNES